MTRSPTAVGPYRADLAYIHDAGYGHPAQCAAQELLGLLGRRLPPPGLVVELGCGSGILSQAVAQAGYQVLGYDLSPAMVDLARQRVRGGEFRCESFLSARLPRCLAVAAIGEVLNYCFDHRNPPERLGAFFRRVHRALLPGGVFLFDVAGPGRAGPTPRQAFRDGGDWVCLAEAREDAAAGRLVRQITTFRRQGDAYRRDDERHELRLFPPRAMAQALRGAGFRVRRLAGYADWTLPPGWTAFAARRQE